jgi:hypothetical protein
MRKQFSLEPKGNYGQNEFHAQFAMTICNRRAGRYIRSGKDMVESQETLWNFSLRKAAATVRPESRHVSEKYLDKFRRLKASPGPRFPQESGESINVSNRFGSNVANPVLKRQNFAAFMKRKSKNADDVTADVRLKKALAPVKRCAKKIRNIRIMRI